ncbi:MAG: MFS transporter [Brevinematales bacterium]|nr:MFS transporter [Brevinematales bacterium]
MKRYGSIVASFVIMLCLGSVYAWSIVAAALQKSYQYLASETQLIFGVLIAVFASFMIIVGRWEKKLGTQVLGFFSAVLFLSGYLVAGFSQGNFWLVLIGIGVLAGLGTSFGYLASLTAPVKWFPEKKGLLTGIAAGGFGLASFLFSQIVEFLLGQGWDILAIFRVVGVVYGGIILVFSFFLASPSQKEGEEKPVSIKEFLLKPAFFQLFAGMLAGTFAGLLVIGSLKSIGGQSGLSPHVLVWGVSLFAITNFLGRLFWGWLSDHIGAHVSIVLALGLQAIGIAFLGISPLTPEGYLALSSVVGFGFGGNFVLFARETAHLYGVKNMGLVYPYVFLGYALAGILGPLTGGMMYDIFKKYDFAIYTASGISVIGAAIFVVDCVVKNTRQKTPSL